MTTPNDTLRPLLGRTRSPIELPRLSMENYAFRKLPPAPPRVNYGSLAMESLARPFMNDRLRCCVLAACAHTLGVVTGNAGTGEVILSDADIEKFYGRFGYIPGVPSTDTGLNEGVVLNDWAHNGIPCAGQNGLQHKIVGSLRIDGSDIDLVRTAIWLFENVIFGVELPNDWLRTLPAPGFVWGIAGSTNPSNGHAFMGFGYNSIDRTIDIDSWGVVGKITDGATMSYAVPAVFGEVHTVLTPDIIVRAKQRAPNGFDFSQLLADFEAMR